MKPIHPITNALITDTDAPVTVYRSQPFNELTLTLTSDAVATAQLYVF